MGEETTLKKIKHIRNKMMAFEAASDIFHTKNRLIKCPFLINKKIIQCMKLYDCERGLKYVRALVSQNRCINCCEN